MTLSKKAIYSLKLALAVTLAYGIGLSMDWEQPRWAAITITLMALTTVGQSLNDAVERIFGTALAGFMTITFLALFSQDRWLYMLSLSTWIAFCTYQAVQTFFLWGRRPQSFWL